MTPQRKGELSSAPERAAVTKGTGKTKKKKEGV